MPKQYEIMSNEYLVDEIIKTIQDDCFESESQKHEYYMTGTAKMKIHLISGTGIIVQYPDRNGMVVESIGNFYRISTRNKEGNYISTDIPWSNIDYIESERMTYEDVYEWETRYSK